MVALQNSGDEKQLWTDLINQLNSIYGCFSFLRWQSSWYEPKERLRVASLRQRKGDLLHNILFPHWQGQTWCKWGQGGDAASVMAWHCLPHSALPSQPVTAQSTAVTSEVSLRMRFILGIQTRVFSMQQGLYHFQDFCWLTLQLAGGCRGSFCSAYVVFAIVSLAPFKITVCLLDRNE